MLSRKIRRKLPVVSMIIGIGLVLVYFTYTEFGRNVWRVGLQLQAAEHTEQSDFVELGNSIVRESRSRSLLKAKVEQIDSEHLEEKTGSKRKGSSNDVIRQKGSSNDANWQKGSPNDVNWQKESPNDVNWQKESPNDVNWQTPDSVFADRRRRVSEVCASDPEANKGWIKGVFMHNQSSVIYCFVPKAGCTFWKRVFYVVNKNSTDYNVYNISRNAIHASAKNGKPYRKFEHDWTHFPLRFTVARDPFSRLLSSYLDKVYLPDFWSSEMLPIIRRRKRANDTSTESNRDFLRSHFDNMAVLFDPKFKDSSTSEEASCGKYVTFAEFVKGGYGRLEPHWMPLSQICNPCKFNVTHISYMETFTQDARAVLDHMGVTGLLDELDKDDQVDEELRMIVDYNFWKRQHSRHVKRCASPQEIAYRLWNNFRWRGYIDPEIDYVPPAEEEPIKVKEDLKSQLAVARVSALKNKAKLKAAKKDFYRQVYLTLSQEMFKRVLRKYSLDFKFYGYEKQRDELVSSFQDIHGLTSIRKSIKFH